MRIRESVTAKFCGDIITFGRMREIAIEYWGSRGAFAYDTYQWANAALFGNRVSVPLFQWALTPHGGALGFHEDRPGRPVITLHPAIWHRGELHPMAPHTAWNGIWAGQLHTFDVIVHELLHAYIACLERDRKKAGLPPFKGETSHNNEIWPAEVMRISPLIGLPGIVASPTKRKRVNGQMLRVSVVEGSISMNQLRSWPYSCRPKDYHRVGKLPLDWEPPNCAVTQELAEAIGQ
jgi:hypothetical protein